MKNILTLIFLSLFLVSCQDISGELEMFKDISLVNQKGSTVRLAEGVREATIRLRSKRKLRLIVGGEKFKFRIPRGTKLPTLNGSIRLSSSEVKQKYDILGVVSTDIERGGVFQGQEGCTYQEPYTQCYPGPNGRPVCQTYMRTVYGFQRVSYRLDTYDKDLSITLLEKDSDEEVAKFIGNDMTTQKVYLYQGFCR